MKLRSKLMSRIKSRGNKSTELAFMRFLRKKGITGWRRHQKVFGMRPDFVFAKRKIAVFVDGCFWHGCPTHCGLMRLSNHWFTKIMKNVLRDRDQMAQLHAFGWKVYRVWEHDLKRIKTR